MSWSRRVVLNVAMSLNGRRGVGGWESGISVLDHPNLGILQSSGSFLGSPTPSPFLFYSGQLNLSFASHLENPSLCRPRCTNRRELGGSTISEHLAATRASLSSLLPAIWQTRRLFNHRKQTEVEFLSWAICQKDKIWVAFEETKESGFFPFFFPVPSAFFFFFKWQFEGKILTVWKRHRKLPVKDT